MKYHLKFKMSGLFMKPLQGYYKKEVNCKLIS